MILSKIPGIEDDFRAIRQVATSGFVVAINVRWSGPEHLHSEFPEAWRETYQAKGYFMFDPIYYWAVFNTGSKRWSEIKLPDAQGVKKAAAKYGLVYGAIISPKTDGAKSFISIARPDREFTPEEIKAFKDYLIRWMDIVSTRPLLTDGEFEALDLIRQGFDQAQTSEKLKISHSMVKKRLSSVKKKFRARTVAEAVSIAVEKRYFQRS